jgi:hypothetical protein
MRPATRKGRGRLCLVRAHMASNNPTKARNGTVEINVWNPGTMVAHVTMEHSTFNRFDYVETMEPLSMYMCW